MNTLSWLIYAAEVSERVQGIAGFIAFMGGFLGGIGILVVWVATFVEEASKKPATILTVVWAMVMLPALVLSAALPSKSTIYMIAASEAGEVIATHPDTVEMMGNLRDIIKKRLREELGDE